MKKLIFLTMLLCCAITSAMTVEFVSISDPGFTGQMAKYETTNAQYCEFLNSARLSGDITVDIDGIVYGASGDFSGQLYYDINGAGYTTDGAVNGGAARINYNGSQFSVDGGFEDHPVTYVSWYGATAFCNYYGYRLPTEDEWQAVADFDGTFIYGCGPTINNNIANYLGSIHPDGTVEVGSMGDPNGYGLCDMAGNVWEWTDSFYPGTSRRIIRGGSMFDADFHCTVDIQCHDPEDYTSWSSGFRVVIPEPATVLLFGLAGLLIRSKR